MSVWTPDSEKHEVIAEFNPAADAAVITLDGLKAIGHDKPILGFSPARSEYDQQMAATMFYSSEGTPIAILKEDEQGRPVVQSLLADQTE